MSVPEATSTAQPNGDKEDAPPPQLRQRRSNKLQFGSAIPSTISEDGQSPSTALPPHMRPPRRASSFMTDSSIDDTRASVRSSTEDLFSPMANRSKEVLHEEPSLWYSVPLLFAVVPAIGGTVFHKGSVFVTDLCLLILAAIYLNWCLITPWVWYHSAQTIRIARDPVRGPPTDEAIADDLDDHNYNANQERQDAAVDNNTPDVGKFPERPEQLGTASASDSATEKNAAQTELELHELFALALCFAGPILGAYLLHVVRTSLSSIGDEMVSNLHLTMFVLGAELRPIRHCMKLVQNRTLHLQRLVRQDPHAIDKADDDNVKDLANRVNEMEALLADSAAKSIAAPDQSATVSQESMKKAQLTLQSQIDALNRAVRRYEKRSTAQTMQSEARLQDLENRLKDALALAAAAANYSQKPGIVYGTLDRLGTLFAAPVLALWATLVLPLRLASSMTVKTLAALGLVQPTSRKRPRSGAAPRSYRERAPASRTLKPL